MHTINPNDLNTITQWMDYIQTLHVREIDLSLERVASVYRRMYSNGVSFKVITVAGTNGKGSTSELIFSTYNQAGYRAAKFTSPHISRFNERFRIGDSDVDDVALLAAFNQVEQHRGKTKLTYFEYGILLAIELFEQADVQVAIIEVGLGGRLDASNILDTDLAIVTSISIDHVAWLGDTVEKIGREKIGIARSDAPCILGMKEPPQSIIDYCQELGVSPLTIGADFKVLDSLGSDSWSWQNDSLKYQGLPLPFAQRGHQLSNAALAVQAIQSLSGLFPVNQDQLKLGISNAQLAGRCQVVSRSPHIVLDVAHNVDSIAGLSDFVKSLSIKGRVYAVCGMLADKQIAESLGQLKSQVDFWYLATIDNERAAKASDIRDMLRHKLSSAETGPNSGQVSDDTWAGFEGEIYDTVAAAFLSARPTLQKDDCLIVFGSFFVVSDIIALINE